MRPYTAADLLESDATNVRNVSHNGSSRLDSLWLDAARSGQSRRAAFQLPCIGVLLVTMRFPPLRPAELWWIFVFAALGADIQGLLGVIADLWAERFNQMAAFQNFVIMLMTKSSGVVFSVQSLPAACQAVNHLNPFFCMTDGFHRSFGVSDVPPRPPVQWWARPPCSWRISRFGCGQRDKNSEADLSRRFR